MVYLDEYEAYLARRGRLASTRRVHRYTLQAFETYLGSIGVVDMRAVTHAHIRSYHAGMEREGFALKSQSGQLQRIRMYFDFLIQERMIFLSPLEGYRLPRGLCGHRPALRVEEIRRILTALATDTPLAIRGKAILELAYSSALRSREIRDLKVRDIDFQQELLFIEQSKNRKDRIVPVGAVALDWVRRYAEEVRPKFIRNQTHPYLFIGETFGRQMSREGLVWAIRETFRHSRIDPFPLSVLRSTAATNLLDAGMSVVLISQLLGHASLRTTQRYLHTAERDLAVVLAVRHPRARRVGEGAVA